MNIIRIEGQRQAGKSWTLKAVEEAASQEGRLVASLTYYDAGGSSAQTAAAVVAAAVKKAKLIQSQAGRLFGGTVVTVDDVPTDSIEEVEKAFRREFPDLNFLFIGVAP